MVRGLHLKIPTVSRVGFCFSPVFFGIFQEGSNFPKLVGGAVYHEITSVDDGFLRSQSSLRPNCFCLVENKVGRDIDVKPVILGVASLPSAKPTVEITQNMRQ